MVPINRFLKWPLMNVCFFRCIMVHQPQPSRTPSARALPHFGLYAERRILRLQMKAIKISMRLANMLMLFANPRRAGLDLGSSHESDQISGCKWVSHIIINNSHILLIKWRYSRWRNYSNPASMSCRLPPVPKKIQRYGSVSLFLILGFDLFRPFKGANQTKKTTL